MQGTKYLEKSTVLEASQKQKIVGYAWREQIEQLGWVDKSTRISHSMVMEVVEEFKVHYTIVGRNTYEYQRYQAYKVYNEVILKSFWIVLKKFEHIFFQQQAVDIIVRALDGYQQECKKEQNQRKYFVKNRLYLNLPNVVVAAFSLTVISFFLGLLILKL